MTTLSESKPQVAILGARGIGQVHARLFQKSGANVCAVLGSTMRTAEQAAEYLQESLGISPKPFDNLERLITQARPDALSICTPPECHFQQILTAFNSGIPVFCEKPLIWEKNLTPETLEDRLHQLSRYQKKNLFLNTCNAYFLEHIIKKIGKPSSINSFSFKFYTQGPHRGKDIGVDLLPHGLSLLIYLLGYKNITRVSQKVELNSYQCQFPYGDCQVSFDFQERDGGLKHLAFSINGREFTRVQKGEGKTYKVFLKDSEEGREIETVDPFQIYISRFLGQVNSENLEEGEKFAEGVANLRMMFQLYFGYFK